MMTEDFSSVLVILDKVLRLYLQSYTEFDCTFKLKKSQG